MFLVSSGLGELADLDSFDLDLDARDLMWRELDLLRDVFGFCEESVLFFCLFRSVERDVESSTPERICSVCSSLIQALVLLGPDLISSADLLWMAGIWFRLENTSA